MFPHPSRVCNLFLAVIVITAISVFCEKAKAENKTVLSEDRKAELANLLEQDCGSCHGLTMKGGLGSPLLPEKMVERDDEDLIYIILNGIENTPMPPWKALLSEADAAWIVKRIKKGQNQ